MYLFELVQCLVEQVLNNLLNGCMSNAVSEGENFWEYDFFRTTGIWTRNRPSPLSEGVLGPNQKAGTFPTICKIRPWRQISLQWTGHRFLDEPPAGSPNPCPTFWHSCCLAHEWTMKCLLHSLETLSAITSCFSFFYFRSETCEMFRD